MKLEIVTKLVGAPKPVNTRKLVPRRCQAFPPFGGGVASTSPPWTIRSDDFEQDGPGMILPQHLGMNARSGLQGPPVWRIRPRLTRRWTVAHGGAPLSTGGSPRPTAWTPKRQRPPAPSTTATGTESTTTRLGVEGPQHSIGVLMNCGLWRC